jgi:hypothetical protein
MTNALFITGAPGSGKHTVAKEINKLKGYKLFHNHLTIDTALSLFDFGTQPFVELCTILRRYCIEAAVRARLEGIIFTFCYEGVVDDEFIESIERPIHRDGGRIVYIHLQCARNELFRRVVNPERAAYGKINSLEGLTKILDTWKCETPIPGKPTLVFNNSNVPPDEIARQIIDNANL